MDGESYFSRQLGSVQQELEEANEDRSRLSQQCEVLQISLDEMRLVLTGERDRAKMKESTMRAQLHIAEEQLAAAQQQVCFVEASSCVFTCVCMCVSTCTILDISRTRCWQNHLAYKICQS